MKKKIKETGGKGEGRRKEEERRSEKARGWKGGKN